MENLPTCRYRLAWRSRAYPQLIPLMVDMPSTAWDLTSSKRLQQNNNATIRLLIKSEETSISNIGCHSMPNFIGG